MTGALANLLARRARRRQALRRPLVERARPRQNATGIGRVPPALHVGVPFGRDRTLIGIVAHHARGRGRVSRGPQRRQGGFATPAACPACWNGFFTRNGCWLCRNGTAA